jgi:hypothetical protein
MDDAELDQLVDAWIAGQGAVHKSPEYERNWWALERVMDWSLDRDTDRLWRFVLAAYRREMPATTAAVLAAGALEDLLAF